MYRENYRIANKLDRKTSLKTIDKIINSDVKNREATLASFVYNSDLHKKFIHNPRAIHDNRLLESTSINKDLIVREGNMKI